MQISLKDLIVAVKEKNLTKTELEFYRDDLANVAALMHIEMAELEKEEALFRDACPEETDAAKKRKWKATPRGLRQIEIKNYLRACDKMLSSLRSRLYSIY